jgi:hypothetical protein
MKICWKSLAIGAAGGAVLGGTGVWGWGALKNRKKKKAERKAQHKTRKDKDGDVVIEVTGEVKEAKDDEKSGKEEKEVDPSKSSEADMGLHPPGESSAPVKDYRKYYNSQPVSIPKDETQPVVVKNPEKEVNNDPFVITREEVYDAPNVYGIRKIDYFISDGIFLEDFGGLDIRVIESPDDPVFMLLNLIKTAIPENFTEHTLYLRNPDYSEDYDITVHNMAYRS